VKSYAERHENGTSFLTGVVPATFVALLAEGKIQQRGVIPPESLDPDPILTELSRQGVDTQVSRTESETLAQTP
jgi:saccharopine dehydrogenase-like NADP-dependent oxidoreductase